MPTSLHRFKSEFFKALGHPVRLAILDALREGEKSVGALCEALELDQSGVSQQLSILRTRGFVDSRRDKTAVFYRTTDQQVYAFLDMGRAIFERQLAQSGEILQQIRAEVKL